MPSIKEFGLREQKEVFAKDYRSGSVSGAKKTILREDGDYSDFLPEAEYQSGIYFDTMACVTFSALNCLETMFRVKGMNVNFSDRFTAKMSGTGRKGNWLKNVAESIRTDGVIDEELWDYPRTQKNPIFSWNDYYQTIPDHLKMTGKRWLVDWDIDWEWIPMNKILEAMKYGPVQVTVWAWPKPDKGGLYSDGGNARRNHAVTLVDYLEGVYYTIYDHYDKTLKRLVWGYDFKSALQFSITKKKPDNQSPMNLPENMLVQDVEGTGAFGLHLNGRILVGDPAELAMTWNMRSDDFSNKRGLTKEAWDSFPKFDLKNNPL